VGRDNVTYRGVIGPHGVGKKNSNGDLLLEFCVANDLTVSNTLFHHKMIHKTSWQHPRSKQWHLLDYVITDRVKKCSIMDTRAMRGTVCETDHNLIRSRIKIVTLRNKHRKVWCRKKDCVPTRLDARKLDDEETKRIFSSKLEGIKI